MRRGDRRSWTLSRKEPSDKPGTIHEGRLPLNNRVLGEAAQAEKVTEFLQGAGVTCLESAADPR